MATPSLNAITRRADPSFSHPPDAPADIPLIKALDDTLVDDPAANVAADNLVDAPSNNASTFASASVLGDIHSNPLANDPADTSANDPDETPNTPLPNHSPIPTPSKLPTSSQSNPSPPAEIPAPGQSCIEFVDQRSY
ncbi:hypothetical protein KVV02_001803 [Mortierella alpina]|uniref:Uncharacterized protein n=1 Tax=Mortierella alpina TaxID=64518 RepID=A0A9P8A6I2_MORAP|nr:hypothetical protein KVV02_001803 [Mortierella alpina]